MTASILSFHRGDSTAEALTVVSEVSVPVFGILGLVFGFRGKLPGTKTPQERNFVAPPATNPPAPSHLHSRLRCATTRQAGRNMPLLSELGFGLVGVLKQYVAPQALGFRPDGTTGN